MIRLPTPVARTLYHGVTRWRGETQLGAHLDELADLSQRSSGYLRRLQAERLARLLSHAQGTSPFYQTRSRGRGASAANAFNLLESLPLLTKSDLQRHRDAMLARPLVTPTTHKTTGGSTAEPVTVVKDVDGVAREHAATWTALGWFGVRIGDPSVRFWGTPLTRAKRLRFALADLAMHRLRLSAFEITDADMERYWQRMRAFRPTWIYGYTTVIDLFAQYLERIGHDGSSLGLRAIVPTAEPLDQVQVDRFSRVFGCPVQNEYGCGEVGAIAYTCEQMRLHVVSPHLVVEVLTDEGRAARPGETGEVVVTDLTNFAMPLIRYRLCDSAVQGDGCECGRPFPTLERVWGRTYDAVYTPRGRRWHGEVVKYLMVELHGRIGGFDQFQVVQTGPDILDIRLVAHREISPEMEQEIKAYVHDRLDGMRSQVRRVDRVERASSGKLRVVRNDWLPAVEQAVPS